MTVFYVRCQDGTFRHEHPFDTAADALRFADWGHACLAAHTHRIIESSPTSPPPHGAPAVDVD